MTCFHTCPEVTKFPRFLLKPTWLNYSCCPILDKANLWDPRVLAFKWNSISVFCYRILPLKLRMVFYMFQSFRPDPTHDHAHQDLFEHHSTLPSSSYLFSGRFLSEIHQGCAINTYTKGPLSNITTRVHA